MTQATLIKSKARWEALKAKRGLTKNEESQYNKVLKNLGETKK